SYSGGVRRAAEPLCACLLCARAGLREYAREVALGFAEPGMHGKRPTAELLRGHDDFTANGCEVVVPAEQLCCGALSVHAGGREAERDFARVLAQPGTRAQQASTKWLGGAADTTAVA